MNLELFFYLTQGILAIILSVFILVLFGLLIYLAQTAKNTSRRVKEVTDEGLEAAQEAKEYVGKIGKAVLDFLIIKSVGSINKKGKKRR